MQHEVNDAPLAIYPNPNNGLFTLELPPNAITDDVYITDALGRALTTPIIRRESEAIRFDMQGLANGAYYIRLQLDGRMQTVPVHIIR
jgi:hypothetical protein